MAPELSRQVIVAQDFVSAAVEQIVTARPRTLVLAGGSTPAPVYERLASCELAWQEMEIFFSDERCVPPDDPASNYGMAYERLLRKVAARVHRMPGETCDAAAYEREIRAALGPSLPTFDLVILGLGADGHTASLFPGDGAPDVEDHWVAGVERPDYRRLTLTLPVLSAARMVLFLVKGEQKRDALSALIRGADIPAARVAARRIVIVADETAKN